MLEPMIEYELLDITFDGLDDADVGMVSEDGPKPSAIVYDKDGVPMGDSSEEVELRRRLIHEFIQRWRHSMDTPKVYNRNLKEFININQVFLIESIAHSAKSYNSTKALFQVEKILEGASFMAETNAKPNDKNQKPFQKMMIMSYNLVEIGRVKLVVGVRFRTHDKVAYSVTVPQNEEGFLPPKTTLKKKKKHPTRK